MDPEHVVRQHHHVPEAVPLAHVHRGVRLRWHLRPAVRPLRARCSATSATGCGRARSGWRRGRTRPGHRRRRRGRSSTSCCCLACSPASSTRCSSKAVPVSEPAAGNAGPQELIPPLALIPILIAMPLMGLRDKVVFLAGRSEQYLPIMLVGATLGCAGHARRCAAGQLHRPDRRVQDHHLHRLDRRRHSKLGAALHQRRAADGLQQPGHARRSSRSCTTGTSPNDLRPGKLAWFMAHVGGTTSRSASR